MKILQIYSRWPEYEDSKPQLKYSCLDNAENRQHADSYVAKKNDSADKNDLHREEYYITFSDVNDTFKPDTAFVVFFKEYGKFYCEELIAMPYKTDGLMVDYFKECLKKHLQGKRLNDMIAVCIEPNHRLSCPVMVRVKDIYELSGKVSETSRT